ncbi:uncharacterized protein LOC119354939 isoform X1 [Triticum dicoccoides]|uniref:uncharacterized protein LOC119354939 isoform X1 n=1 Tax=Triticum dicoccoides TaxID=85692 RepID=UPI00188E3553|nr:uncharacterized protein LOC119354939 isoform X1 [Triticum dicoccoides]XP_044457282.1 uncharacterized protein LOC123189028 isoform X1 [Triticum aestivum]XP_044457283.1 uncharacterized protein LOC123189028 isoform X1 [Triticum aestivum]
MAAAMAETLALAPVEDPEAPLDAAAIRSRFKQLSTLWGGDEEEPVDAAAAEDGLRSGCEADMQAEDAWDSSAAELESRCLDLYIEWLRKEVSLTEEENCKLSAEISVIGETVFKDMIPLDAEIESLESSLNTLGSEGLKHSEASPISTDSGFNQIDIEKDCKYELTMLCVVEHTPLTNFQELKLDHQIGKSEMDLKLLQIQSISMQRDEEMWQLQSLVSGPKVLECKDNCLRVLLKAPILTSECVILGQKLDCVVDSSVSDHELLIEVDEGSMELNKVQIFPADVCVDILIEKLKSSREVISAPSLGWLIRQCQQQIVINTLRRSLVNDANNSRHSFEYFDKDETIVAHLVGAIDAFFKISADWPLSSYGLKLISIRNSGTQPTNITLHLLCKTKELANGLELETRRHLVRFVDAVEEILVREMQSELHSSRVSA